MNFDMNHAPGAGSITGPVENLLYIPLSVAVTQASIARGLPGTASPYARVQPDR